MIACLLFASVLILSACQSSTGKKINPVEEAGLRGVTMIEVMEFDPDSAAGTLYARRLTVTNPQVLDQFVDALDVDLQAEPEIVECIPEYELVFHLQDGAVEVFGYSCNGASFIRGKQEFWQGKDFDPPEDFDTLIEEQLAMNPPEMAPTILVGTEWVLVSLNGESLIPGTSISLKFTEKFLQGTMTCNGYGGGPDSGKYTATEAGTLAMGPSFAVTVQLCSTPEGVMEQEAAYIEALLSAEEYRVVDNRLEINNGAGETMLIFARE
jgi:heat shock protein HslJ